MGLDERLWLAHHGDDDDGHLGMSRLELREHLQPADKRKIDVQKHDIRFVRSCLFKRRVPVGGIPNCFDAQFLQEDTKVHMYVSLIIDDQCSDRSRHNLNSQMAWHLLQA